MRRKQRERPPLPVWRRWEARIGYPRRLLTGLENLLDDYGYRLSDEEKQKGLVWRGQVPLARTAEFEACIKARKGLHRWSRIQLIIGLLLLAVGIILLSLWEENDSQLLAALIMLAAGIVAAALSRRALRRAVHIYIEGESYEAGAEQLKEIDRAKVERAGVASDARLTMRAGVGRPEADWDLKKLVTNKERPEVEELERDLERIVEKVNELLPKLELPEIE